MKKPFHPFLFSVYFVIALLGLNITQVKPSAAYRAIVISLLLAGLLWFLLKLLVRDWGRAAVLTSLYLLLFFTYGHIYHLLKSFSIMGVIVGRHRLLLPVGIFIGILFTWLVVKKLENPIPINRFLNILAIVALVFPVYQITSQGIRASSHRQYPILAEGNTNGLRISTDQAPPDVYYIILDGYPRADFLEQVIGFDNSPFLDELKQRGFYVADCSQSNYAQTSLSMASALNYNYLDALSDEFTSSNNDTSGLIQLLKNSAVRQQLENLGYSFVTFENSYYWLRIPDSDFYFAPSNSALGLGETMLPVNLFEAMLIRESALVLLTDSATVLSRVFKVDMDYPNKEHRELILYTLDKLKTIPLDIQSPKFIYAHIVSPHSPIVFDQNGDFKEVQADPPIDVYAAALSDQIRYLNKRILGVVDEILNTSATPPIIILQGDHGEGIAKPKDRMAILNAYYLPNGGDKQLYSTITPVNTFRVIFDQYFGGQLPLLEDKSYYSGYDKHYDFTEIPNNCQSVER
jgi:hypothetical protein